MTNPTTSGDPMADDDLIGMSDADLRQHIAAFRARADNHEEPMGTAAQEGARAAMEVIRRELKIDQLIRMIPDLKMVIAAHAHAKPSRDNPASSQGPGKQT